jgi:hypothetical protein
MRGESSPDDLRSGGAEPFGQPGRQRR